MAGLKLPVVVALVAGIAVAGVFAWRALGGPDPAAAGDLAATHVVRRGAFDVTLTESGNLVAKDSQKLSTGANRSGKLTFLIDEGTQVEAGEVLARLDTTELERQREQLVSDIVQAETALTTARTELEIQRSDNAAAVEKARLEVTKAANGLERWLDGDVPAERRKFEIAIKEAETGYSRSRKKHEDSQLLFEKTYINKSQLEQDEIEHERAVVQLEGAKLDLAMFEKYTLPMTTVEKEAAVREMERGLANAELRAESMLNQRQTAVVQAEKHLGLLRDRLADTEKEIARFIVTAPIPGIVLYGDPAQPWRSEDIRLGGDVWGSMVLFTLPDLRVMQVALQIHEADINKLEVGQTARITMDTYPGVSLAGSVSRIAYVTSSGDRWNRDNEVKKFDVELLLESREELALKPGISAKAEIFIDRREGALTVPIQAVFREGSRQSCWVAVPGGPPRRAEVVTGLSNESLIEILSGLEEGDRVLLYNPDLPAGGDPATEPDAQEPGGDENGGGGSEPDATTAAGSSAARAVGSD